jgi:hypothetical protein
MKHIIEIIDLVNQYRHLDFKKLNNVTYLVGRALHIAPQAWLHQVFAPLKEDEIIKDKSKLSCFLNPAYELFLKHMNGLNLYSNSLSLYGLRDNYIRDEKNVWQPFDIIRTNEFESRRSIGKSNLIIGSYNFDGSNLCFDADGKILRYDNSGILKISPSFEGL